ncbi:hypothetical protein H311_00674 [Anncaliia algerae PRA109]|nr:hypothetical protein H311_00674 [Anncaliia algerae PRA109]
MLQDIINLKKFVFKSTLERIQSLIINKINNADHTMVKFRGLGFAMQVDETMLNFKCKFHRGRSANNKSDALCIVEVGSHITRAFATVTPNKEKATILPIIKIIVIPESTIFTDEHRSYSSLQL